MNVTELPTRLRDLADRIEAAGFTEGEFCSIDLTIDKVATRGELARWARHIGEDRLSVNSHEHCSTLSRYSWHHLDSIGYSIRFLHGLLGGKEKTYIEDDAAGLVALLAEATENTEARA